jgi:hypothetical protein
LRLQATTAATAGAGAANKMPLQLLLYPLLVQFSLRHLLAQLQQLLVQLLLHRLLEQQLLFYIKRAASSWQAHRPPLAWQMGSCCRHC